MNRRLGVRRARGSREGLTTAQAEAQLRRLMGEVGPTAPQGDRLDVGDAGRRYRHHLAALGRKRSTLAAVEMALRVWIEPHIGGRALESVRPEDVEDMMRVMTVRGLGAKSIRNYVGTLSALLPLRDAPTAPVGVRQSVRHDRPACGRGLDGGSLSHDGRG